MSNFLYSTLSVVHHILKRRDCKALAIITSVSFEIFYMFFTGIITVSSIPIPNDIAVPKLIVSTQGPIGTVPWVIAYLNRYSIFSMNLEAMISTTLISLLVGMNAALMLYHFKMKSEFRCECQSASPVFFASIIPASLSVFSCCGGGLLLILFGAGLMSAVMPYGNLFSIISIIGLTVAILISAYSIRLSTKLGKDLLKDAV